MSEFPIAMHKPSLGLIRNLPEMKWRAVQEAIIKK
jgi:hypothetical protein